MISKNKLKQDIDERSAKNTNVPKGTIIESKIYPSEFSGNRSNIAKTVTSVKKAIPSSNPRQQVDYYLNELSNYIDWATSSSPDPLKKENSFFPSVKRTITFQAAKPKEKDTKQGGKQDTAKEVFGGKKKKQTQKRKGNKSKKGSRSNKNKSSKRK
tara:strand:- start:524 stop:991 length:468 start_codon:yes stop_codon:yes gene_type:complete